MEKWRRVWRQGLAPQLPLAGLRALLVALVEDDPRLVQGAVCEPPPIGSQADKPVECACAISFAGWQNGIGLVGEIESFFNGICDGADEKLGRNESCYFFHWFDDSSRGFMRQELIPEVKLAIEAHEAKGVRDEP